MEKRLLRFLTVFAALSAMMSCSRNLRPPEAEDPTFLDMNVSFAHKRVSLEEGQKISFYVYTSDVAGKSVTELTPSQESTHILTKEEAASGLRTSFENPDRSTGKLYVLAWVDINGNGIVDDGDFAWFYNATSDDVKQGKAVPQNCVKQYAVTIKMTRLVGEDEFVMPEGMVADFDENLYDIVPIGTQLWIKQSLRTTHYQDGTAIPNVSAEAFSKLTTAAYVNPYAKDKYVEQFGLLYNWYAATYKNPCPEGWRVPSDKDFIVLESFVAPECKDLGTDATDVPSSGTYRGGDYGLGTKLKAVSYEYESATHQFNGTDDFGLSLLPGGQYTSSLARGPEDSDAVFTLWTSDSYDDTKAVRRMIRFSNNGSMRGPNNKYYGHSLRCVKENPDAKEKEPLESPVLSATGTIISWGKIEGAVGYKVVAGPYAVTEFSDDGGVLSFDATQVIPAERDDVTYQVFVTALADKSVNKDSEQAMVSVTIKGDGKEPEKQYVSDVAGNQYEVIKIGNQVWMRENLRTTRYSDGSPIIQVSPGTNISSYTEGVCVNPYGTAEELEAYGLLYNWYACTMKNPCPEGWHIPSNADFFALAKAVAPAVSDEDLEYASGNMTFKGVSEKLGYNLKSSADGFGGKENSYFNARPGGTYLSAYAKGYDSSTEKLAVFWTVDEYPSNLIKAYTRVLSDSSDGLCNRIIHKYYAYSVRCVKNQ